MNMNMNANDMIVASFASFAQNTIRCGISSFEGNISAKLISEKMVGGSTKNVKGAERSMVGCTRPCIGIYVT